LLLELEPGLHHSRVAGIFHNAVLMPGVMSCCDLAVCSLEHLAERVLLRLDPAEQRLYQREKHK